MSTYVHVSYFYFRPSSFRHIFQYEYLNIEYIHIA